MLRDKHAVGDEEPPTDGTRPASDAEAGGGGGSGGGSGEGGSGGGGKGEGGGEGEGGDKPAAEGELSPHVWAVPYVLFASSVCFALGSGMTARSPLAPLPGPSRARRLLHVGCGRVNRSSSSLSSSSTTAASRPPRCGVAAPLLPSP